MSLKNVMLRNAYLGVLIDNKLTWSAHTDYTVKKTNETLYS